MPSSMESPTPTKLSHTRPPVVTIMGHVDHGKTSLLDYIRKTKVTAGEHGGITQHIGAYEITSPRAMTFIDTPGHAAFQEMRARGGRVADIVILVIAANEGVKPQTEESLKHIRESGVPFLVALNKSDLPEANSERVKNQLAELGYMTEDRGGQLITVPVSASTGQGVDQLLEMICLMADLQELQSDPAATLEATVIESSMDKGKGPIATVVIKNGSLQIGQALHAENIDCKVKALFNHLGQGLKTAGPSQAVQILGFSGVPPVGSQVHSGSTQELPVVRPSTTPAIIPGDSLPEAPHLNIIIKADTAGSVEAIIHTLPEGIFLISNGVGDISEADILLAKTVGAQVIGFHIHTPKTVLQLAEVEGVKVRVFTIIYELIEFLTDGYKRLIDPLYGIQVQAEAEILAEFKINKDRIAGSKITTGELTKEHHVLVLRDGKVVGKARLKSLRHGKSEVPKVSKGTEFGALLSPYIDFRVGDTIIAHN